MPARKRRILIRDDGERLKKQIAHKAEYWSVETDEWFSIFITTDGNSWAVIEGNTAVCIPNETMDLLVDTKRMYDEQREAGRSLAAYRGAENKRAKNDRKAAIRLDIGKVLALADGGWTIEDIYKECEMDGMKVTKEQIERIVKYGRD